MSSEKNGTFDEFAEMAKENQARLAQLQVELGVSREESLFIGALTILCGIALRMNTIVERLENAGYD